MTTEFPSIDDLMDYSERPKYIVRGKYNEIKTDDIGEGTIISGWTFIDKGVHIGKNCRVANHCNIDRDVFIGDNVNIEVGVVITANAIIEDDVFIGGHVLFIDDKYPYPIPNKVRTPIVIKRNAMIGAGVSLICVTIGENAVIGGGSVVTRDVPANEVWAGSPAKPVMMKDENGNSRIMTRQDFDKRALEQRKTLRGRSEE